MGLINARNTVRTHLFRERFEVFLSVVIPFVFMLESGYANAWIFCGGLFTLSLNTFLALGRGVALEGFIFVCFRLARSYFGQGRRSWLLGIPLLLIGCVAMIVSAGMNLGFMAQSPEMASVMQAVSLYMPGFMATIFRFSLGLLFPVGVGFFAMYDVGHLVENMLRSSHLDNQAMSVQRSEMHRTAYLKSMKRQRKDIEPRYDDICAVDADNMVKAARSGDLSFGSADVLKHQQPKVGVTKITPVPQTIALPAPGPRVASGGQTPALPPLPTKPSAPAGFSQP